MDLTLEQLVAAIRGGAALEELQRMVGPSAEETEAATQRLSRIEALDVKCEWDSMAPSWDAQQARERREKAMVSSAAKEIQSTRVKTEMRHHLERVEWFSQPSPKWVCGTPVGEFDRRILLRQSQEFIAANAV